MRKVYLERQDFFVAQFNDLFGNPFVIRIPQAGLHFVAWLRRETNLATVARACAEIGVKLSPVSSCVFARSSSLRSHSLRYPEASTDSGESAGLTPAF